MEKLKPFLPFLRWKGITGLTLKQDLIAGLVGAIIVLPQGVAFATIAGLPPEYGIYSAIAPAIIAALWGSSWHLVSGPTTAISLVVFSSISPLVPSGTPEYVKVVLTLTFLVGLIQLFMGWMKFGKILNFISHTVVVGFTAGAAILIASSQIKNFFGVKIAQGSSFYETLHVFFTHLNEVNIYIILVASITLASGIIIKKIFPKFPYMIPAMLIGSLIAYFLNEDFGLAVTGIKTVGALPNTLPPLSMPSFDLDLVKKLASPALAVTMLALTEAVAISKAIALRSGQKIDGNQEVIGQGMSNMLGSFFSAYPASGSFNRTGLNFESGAKTPFSSIFAAFFLGIIILFVGPLAAYLPNAVMAAILFLVAWGLIDFKHIGAILKTSRSESILLIATFLSTLFLELEFAVFVGVFMSLAIYIHYASKPLVARYVPDPEHPRRKLTATENLPQCSQMSIISINGSIFFGSIEHVENKIKKIEERYPEQKVILLVFGGVNILDLAGVEMLKHLVAQTRKRGGDIYINNINHYVYNKMEKFGFVDFIGNDHLLDSKPEAIARIVSKLDKEICKKCKSKIFEECK